MRQDQWSNTVSIDGRPIGVWDTVEGGAVEAAETKHRPGAMGDEIALGGPVSVTNLTLTRLLQPSTGDWDYMTSLMRGRVGRAAVSVSRQPLDIDKNPIGKPLVYRGILQGVDPGGANSNSSDSQMWTIMVSTSGDLG